MNLDAVVKLEVVSADITGFFNRCRSEVSLRDLTYKDMLTATVAVSRLDHEYLKQMAVRYGAQVREVQKRGAYWMVMNLFHRPVLVIGLILQMLLMCWLPSRVLFITVDGNTSVPTKYILEQAQQCGIAFGASRREVRSEKMKNSLLGAIPQLQWAGINTKGCTAVISVKEKNTEENAAAFNGISSIVAARDGIVISCTGVRGNMLCRIGQAVYKGDVLISAYTDVGLCVKATQANGEVYAQTLRQADLYVPLVCMEKGDISAEEKKFGLLIGKKRINLYKGSGISGASCDKINLEYYVTLPGGFKLPFGVFVSSFRSYDTSAVSCDMETAKDLAAAAAKKYILSQMVSGKILLDSVVMNSDGEFMALSGQYICLEMIGRVQYEENTLNYGEDNRENR